MIAPSSTQATEVVGRVLSVNVGSRRQVNWSGRTVETGIWKIPVEGRILAKGVNLEGDDQADRRVHGGADKSIYAYASEDYDWWLVHLGRELGPGTFGENLTTVGFDLAGSVIGEIWRVGGSTLRVTQPRLPCYKLGIRMDDPGFVETFEEAGRFGTYLSIVDEGSIGAGDDVTLLSRPDHGLTITELALSSPRPSREMIDRILEVSDVPQSWRKWAERALERQTRRSG